MGCEHHLLVHVIILIMDHILFHVELMDIQIDRVMILL